MGTEDANLNGWDAPARMLDQVSHQERVDALRARMIKKLPADLYANGLYTPFPVPKDEKL